MYDVFLIVILVAFGIIFLFFLQFWQREYSIKKITKNIENNHEEMRKRVIKKYGKDSDQYKTIFKE